MNISHEDLLSYLHYDPETGVFTWLRSLGPNKAGKRAGRLHHSGYRDLAFRGYRTNESRWAVFYMTGSWPPDQVDHKHVGREYRSDNTWANLRCATRAQNFANRTVQSNSKLGVKGVRQLPSGNFAVAGPGKGGRHLGCFSSLEEASTVSSAARRSHYGEFALEIV